MAEKRETHRKLASVLDSRISSLKLRLRMPDWRPDEIDYDDGNGNKGTEVLYVEEALAAIKGVGGIVTRKPFQPSFDAATADWIVGGPLNPKQNNQFDDWLVTLCDDIRRYNRALYRLRRLHLQLELNGLEMAALPDDDVLPAQAERDWQQQVTALREHLDGAYGQDCIVDMIEVNGYIVSVRAIAEIFVGRDLIPTSDNLETLGPQPGGSSSSHISISSCFSSPQ